MEQQQTAILVLEDGTTCYGKAFGAIGTTGGELCFNTGMTGYQEVFTDPSYYGQVLIMNNVHVGNYGVKEEDVESDSIKIKGLIGRNLEEIFSRRMAQGSLELAMKSSPSLLRFTENSMNPPATYKADRVLFCNTWLNGPTHVFATLCAPV